MELNYVEDGPALYLVASDPRAIWAQRAVRTPVKIQREDGQVELRLGAPLSDRALIETVLGEFRHKYGEVAWDRHFRDRQRILVLRQIEAPGDRPVEEVLRGEFDAVADRYTESVEGNPFRRYLRDRSVQAIRTLFEGRDPILELGPGTGVETLELLRAGHHVVAVDISPRMIAQLRQRAEAAGLSDRLETRLGSIGTLATLLKDRPDASVGGVLSTFGALNLDPHVERLSEALSRLLPPGAPFFAGILNRTGLATVGYLLVAGHPYEAVRRLRDPIEADGLLYELAVTPFTSRRFAALFRPAFFVENVRAASVLVPPYWSAKLYDFWGESGRRALARLDRQLSSRAPLRDLGEYLFVTLRRTPGRV